MATLIATLSGHKAQAQSVLRQVQARAANAAPLPAGRDADGIPADLLESDPPGMAAAAEVPARLIRRQEAQMEKAARERTADRLAPLRTRFGAESSR